MYKKKCRTKFLIGGLILLLFTQACGGTTTFIVKADQPLENVANLERNASRYGRKVIFNDGSQKVVKALTKVTSDSVFFEFRDTGIQGFSQQQLKHYKIQRKSTLVPVGFGLMAASVLYGMQIVNNERNNTLESSSQKLQIAANGSFLALLLMLAGVISSEIDLVEFCDTEAIIALDAKD